MLELKAGERHPIKFTLDGVEVRGFAEPRMLLSDFLRHELGRTEIHIACEQGVCGACTIMLDGNPARSCLTFAVQAIGRRVETVRSLSPADGKLNDLQESFRRHHGQPVAGRRKAQRSAGIIPPPPRLTMRLLHARHPSFVGSVPA